MSIQLDKSALFDAMEAFWSASEVGNDKGVEAAIAAYLARMQSHSSEDEYYRGAQADFESHVQHLRNARAWE